MVPDLRDELLQRGVAITPLDQREIHALDQKWLATFSSSLPAEHRAYRWHSFSFGHQSCLDGPPALAAYLSQWKAPFYVFDENLSFCVLCHAEAYPDLSELRRDLYVTHQNMKWTIAFTHEQPHLGPFFAQRLV